MFQFLKICFLFSLVSLTRHVSCKVFEKDLYLELIRTDENAFRLLNPDFDHYLSLFDYILENKWKNVSAECETSLQTLKKALISKDEWALKCKNFFYRLIFIFLFLKIKI